MTSEALPIIELANTPQDRRRIEDVPCLACGCLCDDLVVSIEQGRVVALESACELGRDWYQARAIPPLPSPATMAGSPVDLDDAVARATLLLHSSHSPVIFGLTKTSLETVRAALGLAETLRARIVLDRSPADLGRVSAFQEKGRVTATLGEVKNRADVVVFWGADPLRTHPRHGERYSIDPIGRFVPKGRAGRTIIVIDTKKTATAEKADLFIPVSADRQLESITALRLRLRTPLENKTASPVDPAAASFDNLLQHLKAARYGALFFQTGPQSTTRSQALWEAMSSLVRDLNESTRFVLLGMGTPGNLPGAEAALTWQTGFLQGASYQKGHPSPLDDLTTLDHLLTSGEPDSLLVMSDALPRNLSARALNHLGKIPFLMLGPGATSISEPLPAVAFATSTVGFDAPGIVMRSDGLTLRTRPIAASSLPSEKDLIQRIHQSILNNARSPS